MPPLTPTTTAVDLALVPEHELDILFVIDNSISVQEEQIKLGWALPGFLSELESMGTLPDLHVGIVTTDLGSMNVIAEPSRCAGVGDQGVLRIGRGSGQGCAITDPFIIDVDDGAGGRTRNYDGTLAELLRCAIVFGDDCEFEQPLEAMRLALEPGVNPGFLRDGAQLAIVLLADEDDCSVFSPAFFGPESPELGPLDSFRCFDFGVTCDQADPRIEGEHTNCRAREDSPYVYGVQRYIDSLQALRPGRVTVGMVFGVPAPVEVGRRVPQGGSPPRPDLMPSCQYVDLNGVTNSADPAVRLRDVAEAFGERGRWMSICDDINPSVAALGTQVHDRLVGQPCLRRPPFDTNPDTPELDARCEVVTVGIGEPAMPLAACNSAASNPPCWRLVEDPTLCGPPPTAWRIDAVGVEPTYGRHVQARCDVLP